MHVTTKLSTENLVNRPTKCPFYSKILAYKPFTIKSILFNTVNFLNKKWNLIFASNNVINIYYKGLDSLNWPFISAQLSFLLPSILNKKNKRGWVVTFRNLSYIFSSIN